jgi:hypothetical protein
MKLSMGPGKSQHCCDCGSVRKDFSVILHAMFCARIRKHRNWGRCLYHDSDAFPIPIPVPDPVPANVYVVVCRVDGCEEFGDSSVGVVGVFTNIDKAKEISKLHYQDGQRNRQEMHHLHPPETHVVTVPLDLSNPEGHFRE